MRKSPPQKKSFGKRRHSGENRQNASPSSHTRRSRHRSTEGTGASEGGRNGDQRKKHRHSSSRHQGPSPSRHGRGHHRRRPLSPEVKFLQKYENFIKNHDEARRRYFDQYHRSDDRRRRKLELTFFKMVEELRLFESQLTPEQWSIIEAKKWPRYKNDQTYSTNHNLTGAEETHQEWTDIMLAPCQLNRETFSQDNEVSVGTMEHYKQYEEEKSKKS